MGVEYDNFIQKVYKLKLIYIILQLTGVGELEKYVLENNTHNIQYHIIQFFLNYKIKLKNLKTLICEDY